MTNNIISNNLQLLSVNLDSRLPLIEEFIIASKRAVGEGESKLENKKEQAEI